jgi:hypothetical protein
LIIKNYQVLCNGKSIYTKTVEDIHLNNEINHNIYVADKNRQIVKIFNNDIWQLKNMVIIDKIIDNIVQQFNLSIDEIKKDNNRYEKLKERITNKVKYINYCDTNYIEDLEEFALDNKDKIKRSRDFRDLVFDEIKTLLHDNKNMLTLCSTFLYKNMLVLCSTFLYKNMLVLCSTFLYKKNITQKIL